MRQVQRVDAASVVTLVAHNLPRSGREFIVSSSD